MSNKQLIRTKISKKKSSMSKELVKNNSEHIVYTLINDMQVAGYDNIFCYVNFNQEVETCGLLSYLLDLKRNVYVPKVYGKFDMRFHKLSDLELDLEKGKFGILEPKGMNGIDANDANKLSGRSIIIIPGLAFDEIGNRIGYGGGFYDTFLAGLNMLKVAICHDFQVIDKCPDVESTDVLMDYIITEKRSICCLKSGGYDGIKQY